MIRLHDTSGDRLVHADGEVIRRSDDLFTECPHFEDAVVVVS
jgi:hypothetical protein